MSWESTVPYYQIINRKVAEALGGLHSAKLVLHSVDFQEVEQLQHTDRWNDAASLLADGALLLQGAGDSLIGRRSFGESSSWLSHRTWNDQRGQVTSRVLSWQ